MHFMKSSIILWILFWPTIDYKIHWIYEFEKNLDSSWRLLFEESSFKRRMPVRKNKLLGPCESLSLGQKSNSRLYMFFLKLNQGEFRIFRIEKLAKFRTKFPQFRIFRKPPMFFQPGRFDNRIVSPPVVYPASWRYLAKVLGSCCSTHCVEEQFSLLVSTWWLCA